jgi:hypothetical protein
MEAILALILAGAIARTPGLWPATRTATVVVVLYAILLDFTPLHAELQAPARYVWIAMFVLWGANVVMSRRAR